MYLFYLNISIWPQDLTKHTTSIKVILTVSPVYKQVRVELLNEEIDLMEGG